jgi:cysteine desulfurase family protein
MIYCDNAATSWPKPPGVADAMHSFIDTIGANPGRAAHRQAIAAARIVYETRDAVAALLGAPDPLRVVFCRNVTEALNVILSGMLRPGNRVITSSMEHNSMMRPLRALESARGIQIDSVQCSSQGVLHPADIESAIRPETALIALTHASNVTGTLLPVAEAGAIARKHGLLLCVDAAQTAGACPIDMGADMIDILAFTGHKSLYGPMGTGGFVLGERVDESRICPLMLGGTGSRSEEEQQPEFVPDKFESGTPNVVGLAGLRAGIQWVSTEGVETIRAREIELTRQVVTQLQSAGNITVYGTGDATKQTATISFNIHGASPTDIGLALDERFEIFCRAGLHCSPAGHKTIGTFPGGTVRVALGAFTTDNDVEEIRRAILSLAEEQV